MADSMMIILGLRQFWHSKRPVSLVMNTSACPNNKMQQGLRLRLTQRKSILIYVLILSRFYLQAKLQQANTSTSNTPRLDLVVETGREQEVRIDT